MPTEENSRDREIAALDDAIRQTTIALAFQQALICSLKRAIEVSKEKAILESKLAKSEKRIQELKKQIDVLKHMGDENVDINMSG